jgi:hypothetical protein
MSKKNENGDTDASRGVETPEGVSSFCAIEEHARALNVSVPVFAAVVQANKWAAGKKIERRDFEKGVKDFLDAPVGGRK